MAAMDTGVVIALIALAGSIVSTAATVFGAPAFQARRDARKVLNTYREPLIAASYELQARLHNILTNEFTTKYVEGDERRSGAAVDSTLYVFAQFFAWREIIRREIQFLQFERDHETREIARLVGDIGETFLTDDLGTQLMIWRVEQRGLGEQMIVTENGRQSCMGYAAFVKDRAKMKEWLDPIEEGLRDLNDDGRRRLVALQHLLVDLVRKLDPNGTRYPFTLEKA
jgi:hypothetical protein